MKASSKFAFQVEWVALRVNNGRYLIEGEQLAQLLNALTVTPDLIEEVAIRVFFPT